jgi:hypothetical protein
MMLEDEEASKATVNSHKREGQKEPLLYRVPLLPFTSFILRRLYVYALTLLPRYLITGTIIIGDG